MSSLHYAYQCIKCGRQFYPDKPYYTCPNCNDLLLVTRDLDYLRNIRIWPSNGKSGVFDLIDLILPGFPAEQILSLREGHTPLWRTPDWLLKSLGMKNLFIKNEGRAPSGSFKDRGMPVAISETLRLQAEYPGLNIHFVACASTGDTSASASIYCAYVRDRLKCIVLIPNGNITPAQGYQIEDTGAVVLALDDNFDGCMRIVQQFTSSHPEIVLVNSKNAMRIVGQETISLEIFKDLDWQVPDWLAVPVGNAGNVAAQMSAWLLLKNLDIIQKLPKLILAQTKTANTVVRWINSGFKVYEPGKPGITMASAMNIQNPVSQPRIDYLRKDFEIYGFDVSEDNIAETRALFNRAGAGLCTQGAVTLNAVLQAKDSGLIQEKDIVVAINTANDLKFVEAGSAYHRSGKKLSNPPVVLEATLEAVNQAVANLL